MVIIIPVNNPSKRKQFHLAPRKGILFSNIFFLVCLFIQYLLFIYCTSPLIPSTFKDNWSEYMKIIPLIVFVVYLLRSLFNTFHFLFGYDNIICHVRKNIKLDWILINWWIIYEVVNIRCRLFPIKWQYIRELVLFNKFSLESW